LTINLPDIQEAALKYELTPTSLSFSARAGKCGLLSSHCGLLNLIDKSLSASKGLEERDFSFNIDFFAEVVPEVL